MKTMKDWPRCIAKRVLSRRQRYKIKKSMVSIQSASARRAFAETAKTPEWLDENDLLELCNKYPPIKSRVYDEQQLPEVRDVARIEQYEQSCREQVAALKQVLGKRFKGMISFLEIGCGHGLVAAALQRDGKRVTAVDLTAAEFSDLAKTTGVELMEADAENLDIEDESYDVVFTFNSFEHFDHPEAAFKEALRVLKQHGYLYTKFAPLYFSPFGLHAQYEIGIPYCQLLFPKSQLRRFLKGGETHSFWHLNGWPIDRYRSLWVKYEMEYEKIQYHEGFESRHVDLIAKYPSCFRSKTDCFEDLVVDKIELLFRKK